MKKRDSVSGIPLIYTYLGQKLIIYNYVPQLNRMKKAKKNREYWEKEGEEEW